MGRALLVAVLSAASWYAWMDWDTDYQVDAAGSQSGPYEAWQVVGCGLTLVAILVAALWTGAGKVSAPVALTVGFTAAWTIHAATRPDQTGLFAIGAILVLMGVSFAATLVTVVFSALRR